MNKIETSRKILDLCFSAANIPLLFRGLLLGAKNASSLRLNKSLRDSHRGERCLILGGGPSLRNVSIERIAEFSSVITVNKLFQWSHFKEIAPIFHCAVDPVMYQGEVGKALKRLILDMPDTMFLLSNSAPGELKACENVRIAVSCYQPSSLSAPYDLSKPSASFINVVLFAIELAMYMGFSEIILLGCDFNQFASRKESHVYEEEGKMRASTLFSDLMGHAIAIMQHDWLREECGRRNIRVMNATKESLLDVWPKIDLKSTSNN